MVLTSADRRRGTICVQTGQICQQSHHTFCRVRVVAEDRGRDRRSATDGSGLRSVILFSKRELSHVCTAVKDDWQGSSGMNAGTKGGENEFGNGDQNASNAYPDP